MSRYWNQNKSTFRKGEPTSHKKAKNISEFYLKQFQKFVTRQEYPFRVFANGNMIYRHPYDLVAFPKDLTIHGWSIHNLVKLEDDELLDLHFKDELDKLIVLVIEIDDLWLHSHKQKQYNDMIAQEFAEKYFSEDLVFLRLKKEELNGEPKDSLKYMRDEILEKIKWLLV